MIKGGKRVLGALAVLLTLWTGLALAGIPHEIHYQGRLTRIDNAPLSPGVYKITIRLYESEEGGSPVWWEEHDVEIDSTGYFSINLGEENPLDIPFDRPYWMSVEVNGDGEMSPRLPLLSVGYSMNSEALDGIDSSQFVRSDEDDVVEGKLTIEGGMEFHSGVKFKGPSVDIESEDGENLRIKAGAGGSVVVDLGASSSSFKVVNGSLEVLKVDRDGNVVIGGSDSSKVVKIYPGNLLVGDSAPVGFFSGGDVYVSGDLYVKGAVNFSASSTGGNALTIDVDHDEALLVRKDNDNGDVFVVDTINSEVEVSSGEGVEETSRKSIVFKHDGTNGKISTTTGDLILSPNSTTKIQSKLQVLGQTQVVYGGGDALIVAQTGTSSAIVTSGGPVKVGSGTINHLGIDDDGSLVDDLYVAGDMEVDGSVWLGDATSDNLTVTGSFNLNGDFQLGGDIDMQSHRIYNIGTLGSEFLPDGTLHLRANMIVNGTSTLYGTILMPNSTSVDLRDNAPDALDVESGLLHIDTANRRIGINTVSPTATLHVGGDGLIEGDFTVGLNTAPSLFTVKGSGTSGDYSVKIFVGDELAAWVRKK